MRGLLDSLILYERIETTEAKAKELAPYFERQVTHAKLQTLAGHRAIMAETINPIAAQKLSYDLVNGFASRQGGYTRIIKTGTRLGDGAPMAIVELVLDDKYVSAQSAKAQEVTEAKAKAEEKKPTTKADKKAAKKSAEKGDEAVTTKITGVKAATAQKPKIVRRASK